MTNFQLTTVGIRLVGLYFLFTQLQKLPEYLVTLMDFFDSPYTGLGSMLSLLFIFVLVVMAVLLFTCYAGVRRPKLLFKV